VGPAHSELKRADGGIGRRGHALHDAARLIAPLSAELSAQLSDSRERESDGCGKKSHGEPPTHASAYCVPKFGATAQQLTGCHGNPAAHQRKEKRTVIPLNCLRAK